MEFINIITADTGVIGTIITFPFPSTNIEAQKETAHQAEELFKKNVREINDELTDEEIEELLEDGSYREHTGGGEVHIIWSENTANVANK